jgi:CPA2 family monovalent cation:H+ antiporter-2
VAKNHIIICGFSTLGRIIATSLEEQKIQFVIISDDLRHVLLARKRGYMAYFGHLDKLPVLESLKADEARSIIITLSNITKKRLICESILAFHKEANLVVKIDSIDERKELKNVNIKSFVHAQQEVGQLLVKESLKTL